MIINAANGIKCKSVKQQNVFFLLNIDKPHSIFTFILKIDIYHDSLKLCATVGNGVFDNLKHAQSMSFIQLTSLLSLRIHNVSLRKSAMPA
jgi:hypothetical protein